MTPQANALLLAAQTYKGWTYGPMSAGSQTIDCCALAAQLIRAVRGWPRYTKPGRDWWKDMMIIDTTDVWSPVSCNAQGPIHGCYSNIWRPADEDGGDFPEDMQEGEAYLCQGWLGLVGIDATVLGESKGHTWIWFCTGPGEGFVLESSGKGPRIWDLNGRRPIDVAFDTWGELTPEPSPMTWAARAAKWTSGVAYVRVS